MGWQSLNQPFSFFQLVKLRSGSWRSGTYRRNTSSSSSSSRISTSCRGISCLRGMKKSVLTLTFSLVYYNIHYFNQVVSGSLLVLLVCTGKAQTSILKLLHVLLKLKKSYSSYLNTLVAYRSINNDIFPFDSSKKNHQPTTTSIFYYKIPNSAYPPKPILICV